MEVEESCEDYRDIEQSHREGKGMNWMDQLVPDMVQAGCALMVWTSCRKCEAIVRHSWVCVRNTTDITAD